MIMEQLKNKLNIISMITGRIGNISVENVMLPQRKKKLDLNSGNKDSSRLKRIIKDIMDSLKVKTVSWISPRKNGLLKLEEESQMMIKRVSRKRKNHLSNFSTDNLSQPMSVGRELSISQSEIKNVEIVGLMLPPLLLKVFGKFLETHILNSQFRRILIELTINQEVVVREDVSLWLTSSLRRTELFQLQMIHMKESITLLISVLLMPSIKLTTNNSFLISDILEMEIVTL